MRNKLMQKMSLGCQGEHVVYISNVSVTD